MVEYNEFRCCMCPQVDRDEMTCPPVAPMHPKATPCRFVREYIDKRGWQYKVMGGISMTTFKARFKKPGKTSYHGVKQLPWRDSFDAAQRDLNVLARNKGWQVL